MCSTVVHAPPDNSSSARVWVPLQTITRLSHLASPVRVRERALQRPRGSSLAGKRNLGCYVPVSSPEPVHPEILVASLSSVDCVGHRSGAVASISLRSGVPPRAISSPFDFVCTENSSGIVRPQSQKDQVASSRVCVRRAPREEYGSKDQVARSRVCVRRTKSRGVERTPRFVCVGAFFSLSYQQGCSIDHPSWCGNSVLLLDTCLFADRSLL